jgi:hypothetical protein
MECPGCKIEFEPTKYGQRFHNRKCRTDYWNRTYKERVGAESFEAKFFAKPYPKGKEISATKDAL